MKKEPDLVMFQGHMVEREYRDAYMSGYDNPYKSWERIQISVWIKEKYSLVYEKGQSARRYDDCMEGTF